MSGRICVIGSANVDFIMQLPHLPAVGETVTDGAFMQVYGGKGANQAVAAARAGGEVSFVARVGQDMYGPRMIDNFQRDGIDTSAVEAVKGVASGTALVMFDGRGENYLAVAPGANYQLKPEHIDACETVIAKSQAVLLQMEIPPQTNERVLEIAARLDVPVLFNYAPTRGGLVELSEAVTALIVNEAEAAELSGHPVDSPDDVEVAAAALRKRGPRCVILTLGDRGAWVCDKSGGRAVSAFEVDPVDTTAAGDTFCGALGVAMVEGQSIDQAVRFAAAAAAICCTQPGAQPSVPKRELIERFLSERDSAA